MKEAFNRKYVVLYENQRWVHGHPVYRIQAVRDFADVKAGEIGGYMGAGSHLSHEGNAWVGGDAVIEDGHVTGNAWVEGNAYVRGACTISGDAFVGGRTTLSGHIHVQHRARIDGRACVYSGRICGDTHLTGTITVWGAKVETGTYSEGFLNETLSGRLIYDPPAPK